MSDPAMNSFAASWSTMPQPQPDSISDPDIFVDDAIFPPFEVHYDMNGFEMNGFMNSQSMPPPPTPRPESQSTQPPKPTSSIKQQNRRFTAEEWEEQKPTICRLYGDEDQSLPNVRELLAKSGFDATLRQLKRKVKDWNMKKNVKTHQMIAIARVRGKRKRDEGKESLFHANGSTVDNANIDRFLKRKKLSEEKLLSSPSPADAPSPAFSVYTPHPSTPGPGSNTPNFANSGTMLPPPSPAPENRVLFSPSGYAAPSPTPSFSWIDRSSTPFTGQSPAPFPPETFYQEVIRNENPTPRQEDHVEQIDQNAAIQGSATDVHFDLDALDQLEPNKGQPVGDPPLPVHGKRPYQDKENYWRDKLLRLELIHGREHPETFDTSRELSKIFITQGRYKSAETHLRHLAKVSRRSLGQEDLLTLRELALTFQLQGRYATAEKMFCQILKILIIKTPNLCGEQAVRLKSDLATLYHNQARRDEACTLYSEVLEANQKLHGHEHEQTLKSMSDLASSFSLQGSFIKAAHMLREVLRTQIEALGAESLHVATTKLDLARSLSTEGLYGESEKLSLQAHDSRRKILGSEHPDTLTAEYSLGCRLSEEGRDAEAEIILRRVGITQKKVLGKAHPYTINTAFELGYSLERQRRNEEAERVFKDVIDCSKHILGESHPKTLEAMCRIAVVNNNQGKHAQAEVMHREVLNLRREVNKVHPDTFESEFELANTINNQDRHDEAEEMIRDCMARSKRALGEEHRMTINGIWFLARVRRGQRRFEEARDLYRDVVEKMEKFLGVGHPGYVQCVEELEELKEFRI